MEKDDRQFLLTTAWLFARHGQATRARLLCEALVEADPRDGVSAAALAELLLVERNPSRALAVIRAAVCPRDLSRVAAVLETRALLALGRKADAARRWDRYLQASKGGRRNWAGTGGKDGGQ